MLRRRSRGVARFSEHMLGHAVDFYIPGVPLEELRVIGLRMQRGGVGFYPTSGSPFVHMDTGGVRMWPRMTRDQLLHVFPDGRTVYLPTDGRPLPGYALALAELKRRGQNPTQTWFDVARAEGLDKNIVLASNDQPNARRSARYYDMTEADREEDAREAAAAPQPVRTSPSPVAQTQPANALLAALEREAARRRTQASMTATAPASGGGALYQTASYTGPAAGSLVQPAVLTPNQIIAARGYWQGADEDSSATQTAELSDGPVRHVLFASVADATGSITPNAGALEDRVSSDLALSYAHQANPDVSPATSAAPNSRAMLAQAGPQHPPTDTTIALKRAADQIASTIVEARPRLGPVGDTGTRFDDPWLDAILVSPSVRQYLTALALGPQDYSALESLVQKPASSLLMTFGADPNPGMTYDRFTGSAVVFMATHTASLQ
jgi:hypothetical protein